MDITQALIYVGSGVITVVLFYIALSTAWDKWKKSFAQKVLHEDADDRSLDKNWKVTRELKTLIETVARQTEATNLVVIELALARNKHVAKEKLKYDATKELVKYHMSESTTFRELYESFLELEKKEEEAEVANHVIAVPSKSNG